ncbi:GGDEF domain-containing protein [Candidatus Mycobacterium wuenschmannii]|uniref:GGDEF domain-containing protein n=1 Tax=Candidatus Mycobacterium wuenschmannii TaxID=3027808 RepID=A0ABY8VV87_9MYCO|nr:GGDEF domain-containing protein [Candidatus Mycobacterium wuenschmannii]WIM86577.1 GGDEF domain-containing protein [Candidatus Mycobacterium wuenschmannii]
MGWFSFWWRQPDHYNHVSALLAARKVEALTRATTGGIAAGLALMALGTLWIPGGPRGEVARGCAVAACLGAALGASAFVRRWPTRAQAIRFALLSSVSIAIVALAQHDPLMAVLTLTPLAMLASYIALFHAAWVMLLNLAIAAGTGLVEAARVAQQYNLVAAVCAYGLLLMLNLATPFGIQTVAHVLGTDALLAERDQLTGLLTRHAYQRCALACVERATQQQAYVVVSVIDLDRFKQLNDSYGHSTGDDALVSVARALRDSSDDAAVIGRAGGEEFVIAASWHPDDVGRKAQQLCEVIAALPFGITASVGTAGSYPAYRTGSAGDLLVELTAAADAAMYVAKRDGGNRAGHHEWPLPPPLSDFPAEPGGYVSDELTA